ncbi:CarD family transcriptional regulator [Hyphomicrobium sp.]|uniref:CarD family transcriptional regulator n=1 Tax=Hyphomicrobium sp. TaxID=82 RepID=UPI002FE109E1
MAQKNKAHVKARTSKPAASKTAPRPSKTKTVVAKAGTKKPVAVSSSHARKPIAVKPAVAKPAKAPVAAKPAAKAPEARKPAAVAAAAPAAAKPAQPKAAASVRPAGAIRPGPVRPGHVAVTPARAAAALAKTAGGQKLTAPVQPSTPKDIAEKTAAARQIMTAQNTHQSAQKKSVSQRHGFKTNEFIVYPAHGVGRIVGIEEQEIAGMSLELFVITFDKEKLTLRVPTGKLESVGMRKLADDGIVKKAMDTLKGRARVKRTMWSRRAQEYVAKINSGDLVSIAEVVRDLYRSEAQPEQSYSERQLYEDALDRMAREIAAVEKLDERGAVQRITDVLSKSARGRRLAEGADPADMRAA